MPAALTLAAAKSATADDVIAAIARSRRRAPSIRLGRAVEDDTFYARRARRLSAAARARASPRGSASSPIAPPPSLALASRGARRVQSQRADDLALVCGGPPPAAGHGLTAALATTSRSRPRSTTSAVKPDLAAFTRLVKARPWRRCRSSHRRPRVRPWPRPRRSEIFEQRHEAMIRVSVSSSPQNDTIMAPHRRRRSRVVSHRFPLLHGAGAAIAPEMAFESEQAPPQLPGRHSHLHEKSS